jgi:hypothetical protein
VSRAPTRRRRQLGRPVERDPAYVGLVLSGWIPSSTEAFDDSFEAEPARTRTEEDPSDQDTETT